MPPPAPSAEAIREALNRKALASARQRRAIARVLRISDSEVLAILHLGRAGALTPGELSALLLLTSGGATALVQRLEREGHVVREPHPLDGRSSVLRLSEATERRASSLMAPLVTELDDVVGALSERERSTIERFLAEAAQLTETHAAELARTAGEDERVALGEPVPGLWS